MRLSIVTPSYNQADFLERTLRSVIQQKDQSLEYIVVDGQSDDGSQEILRRYEHQISTLIIEPDDGQADAVQKGLALASGEILAFLNSDDMLLPGTVHYVLDFFQNNPEVDVLYSNRIFVNSHDTILGYWILPKHSNYCMSRWDFIPQETCFWRREIMHKSGSVDPSFGFALDYDLFVRMMKNGQFRRESRFLATFRVHQEAKSTRLYETLGRQEVDRVRAAQDIQIHWYDWFLKYVFGGGILSVSWLFRLLRLAPSKKLTVEITQAARG